MYHYEDDDDDIVEIGKTYNIAMEFKPIILTATQSLCKILHVQCKRKLTSADSGELGPPRKIVKMQGDGNCFFRAISEAVCDTDEYHGRIREAVVNQLRLRSVL